MRTRRPARRYPRTARVNEVVLEVLAEELKNLSDPRLGFVTLTGVHVSPDLRHATVYFSEIGPSKEGFVVSEAQATATGDALRSASRHLRTVLGSQVRMKYLPELTFLADPAIAQGELVDRILRDLQDAEGESLEVPGE